MAEPTQAAYVSVCDAGLVRARELGRALLAEEANYQDTKRSEQSLCDLRWALENIGRLADAGQALTVQAYAQETYGLLGLGLDPLLAPFLPAIPSQGAQVRPVLLGIQGGKVLGIQGGKVLALGYRLAPVAASPPMPPAPATPADPPAAAPLVPATMPITVPFTNQTMVTVAHNLGRPVNVVVLNTNDDEVEGSISSTLNSVTVSFSEPLSGTLYIS